MELKKEIFELLLDEAVNVYYEKYLTNEETFDDDNIEFSQEHIKKMNNLFRKVRMKDFVKNSQQVAQKVAVVFIVTFAAINIFTLGVEAYRVKFLNNMIEHTDKYTEVSHTKDNQYNLEQIKLSYIPLDFKIKREEISDSNIYLKFEGTDDKYFSISADKVEGTTQIDTENANVKYIDVNGYNVMMIYKNEENIAYWNDSNFAYSLYGNIDEDEILKIIEEIKS